MMVRINEMIVLWSCRAASLQAPAGFYDTDLNY